MIKLRITLESKELVIREIAINEMCLLKELHLGIINLFNLEKLEMASFYVTDENLNILKEIPLIETDQSPETLITMSDIRICELLNNKKESIIYVQDFLKMWRFHIEYLNKVNSQNINTIDCIRSIGEIPEKAPEINFNSINIDDDKTNFDHQDIYDEYK